VLKSCGWLQSCADESGTAGAHRAALILLGPTKELAQREKNCQQLQHSTVLQKSELYCCCRAAGWKRVEFLPLPTSDTPAGETIGHQSQSGFWGENFASHSHSRVKSGRPKCLARLPTFFLLSETHRGGLKRSRRVKVVKTSLPFIELLLFSRRSSAQPAQP